MKILILRRRQTPSIRTGQERRFLRQAQDTEFIEVQYQPLPTGRQAEQTQGFRQVKVEGLIFFRN
jgi:hypothetical protein